MKLTSRGFRLLLICLVAAAIAAAILTDKNTDTKKLASLNSRVDTANQNARSRVWYCVGGGGTIASPINSSIHLANRSTSERKITITIYSSTGEHVVTDTTLAANSISHIELSDYQSAPFASAVVNADGEGIVAELSTSSSRGESLTPCQTKLDSDWFFADGSTERDASGSASEDNKTVLSILNPSADAVSIDIDVIALNGDAEPTDPNAVPDEDTRSPAEWHNVRLNPSALTTIDVGSIVQRRVAMAIRLHADPGRVAVGESIVRSGSSREGVTVNMGSAPAKQWFFGFGVVSDNYTERISAMNFGDNVADANVLMQPFYPTSADVTSIEAISRTVAAGQFDFFNVNIDGRVPQDVQHGWIIESDVPVVVSHSLDVDTLHDIGEDPGVSAASSQWIVPFYPSDHGMILSIANVATGKASVQFTIIGRGASASASYSTPVVLSGSQRVSINVSDLGLSDGQALIVKSSRPVIVEQALQAKTGAGFSLAPAIPLG